MRLALVLAILCRLATPASAEPTLTVPASMLAPDMPSEVRLALVTNAERELRRGRALRNGGMATTIVGLVLTVVGIPLLARSLTCYQCAGTSDSAGIALTALGPITAIIGAPIWSSGHRKVKRAEAARLALGAGGVQLSF